MNDDNKKLSLILACALLLLTVAIPLAAQEGWVATKIGPERTGT